MPIPTFLPKTSVAPPATTGYPDAVYESAFANEPLFVAPSWTDLTSRGRGLSLKRGRSYEFDRMEAGTLTAILNNRDAALSPENATSPYAPLRSTRQVRARLLWNATYYPLFKGISEGYPQAYPSAGLDALVEQHVTDLFYALNHSRFTPGSTTITADVGTVVTPDGTSDITVASTVLPMPQAMPFAITIDSETMSVLAINSATSYHVLRTPPLAAHTAGATVSTLEVRFAAELSGTRIQHVLEALGFDNNWWDLDPGQSVMAASPDLFDVNPLEHINLIADAEFGRFFCGRDGRFTFRDRHSLILDYLTPVMTFKSATLLSGASDEVPYSLQGPLEHSDEKLFNRVRITIPTGEVIEVLNQSSIDQHFERIFEREWPYANRNDAVSAANFILARASEDTLRLPRLDVQGVADAADLWPLLLNREIGDRCRFRAVTIGGGTEIDKDVVIDGISHRIAPKDHVVSFDCTEVDPQEYWILGLAGYSELGNTTWAAF